MARVAPSARLLKVSESELNVSEYGSAYDSVIMSHVLEHTFDPVNTARAAMSLVAEGGHLFLAVPNPARPRVLRYGIQQKRYSNHGHVVCWDPAHWRNFLERILGWEVEEYLADEVQVFPPRLKNRVQAIRSAEVALAKALPWWAFSNIAVIAKAD